jgi:hypothetical protein
MHESPVECSHELCNCSLTGPVAGETYCSDYCLRAMEEGLESETCACGHPQCDVV